MCLIDKDCILFDIDKENKDQVILSLISILDKKGSITSEERFYQDVLAREKICPTLIGFEIALPHGRTENVLKPSLCFGRLMHPVVWDEQTNEKVRFVILIAVPQKGTTDAYMKMISALARQLMHEDYRTILTHGSQEEVFELLNETIRI
ncbi:MAG: PTS sugar transporter subunit IIA [Longibaculum sp.]